MNDEQEVAELRLYEAHKSTRRSLARFARQWQRRLERTNADFSKSAEAMASFAETSLDMHKKHVKYDLENMKELERLSEKIDVLYRNQRITNWLELVMGVCVAVVLLRSFNVY
jgi:hypothetical protein